MRPTLVLAIAATLAARAEADCSLGEPKVAYSGGQFKVTFCAGDDLSEDGDLFVGVTLKRARDGFLFDLPAKQVKAADVKKNFTYVEKVGAGFTEYSVALWPGKSACDAHAPGARHGCKTYGYLLGERYGGGPLWGWPKNGWGDAQDEQFESITPRRIQVLEAGAGPELVAKATSVLTAARYTVVDGGKAQKPRLLVEVLYRNAWERPLAWAIVEKLKKAEVGIRWDVAPWPEAPETYVIALGR